MTNYITVNDIIAQMDNDFGFDNSDWIPRMAMWCRSALSEIGITMELYPRFEKVHVDSEHCFRLPDDLSKLIYIFSEEGCIISKKDYMRPLARGRCDYEDASVIDITNLRKNTVFSEIGEVIRVRTKFGSMPIGDCKHCSSQYIYIGNRSFRLTGNHDHVFILYYSNTPSDRAEEVRIPDIIEVVEAVKWYCLWKILGRGGKHPVYSLGGANQTNPQWQFMFRYKDIAKAKYIKSSMTEDVYDGITRDWVSSLYNVLTGY